MEMSRGDLCEIYAICCKYETKAKKYSSDALAGLPMGIGRSIWEGLGHPKAGGNTVGNPHFLAFSYYLKEISPAPIEFSKETRGNLDKVNRRKSLGPLS